MTLHYFLIPTIAVGLALSYIDIKENRIPNIGVLILLINAVVMHIVLRTPALEIILTFIYATLIGFGFWFVGIWPAGDGKLFIAYSLLFPTTFYLQGLKEGLLLSFMINTFVPLFLFMMVIILYRSKQSMLKEALRYSLNPYRTFMVAIILFGFVWLVSIPIQLLNIKVGYFTYLLLLFIGFELLNRFFTAKTELFFMGCAILRAGVDFLNIASVGFVLEFVTLLGAFLFFRFFILHLAYHLYTEKKRFSELKEGMVPAEGIKKRGKKYEKVAFFEPSLIGFFSHARHKFIHNIDELTKKDIEKLKRMHAEGKLEFDILTVSKTQPFAIFLLIGYILTLICPNSFLRCGLIF
jgi:Flp pilus assembly protein protease CpaA